MSKNVENVEILVGLSKILGVDVEKHQNLSKIDQKTTLGAKSGGRKQCRGNGFLIFGLDFQLILQ